MTNPATTSLLDRANLDRDQVRNEVARGLSGADDGELFLEYSQTEALMFDNGRLKQATYDTSQGFGLRAVKDDAVGYAHSSDVSLPALIRAADAVAAVRGGGLRPTRKSADAPTEAWAPGTTRVVVGSTLRSEVVESEDDVLIAFHAPYGFDEVNATLARLAGRMAVE